MQKNFPPEKITVKINTTARESSAKKSVFSRLGDKYVDNADPESLEKRRDEIKQELKRVQMDYSIKKGSASGSASKQRHTKNSSTSSDSSSGSDSDSSSDGSSSSSSDRNTKRKGGKKVRKVHRRSTSSGDERQHMKKPSSHRHSGHALKTRSSSKTVKKTTSLKVRPRQSLTPPAVVRRRSPSVSPARHRLSSKAAKVHSHERKELKDRKREISRDRYREKEFHLKEKEREKPRDQSRTKERIRSRSPRRSPIPRSREIKRKSLEKRHSPPSRIRQTIRRDRSVDRERERREKERQEREIARNKEREEALARCQERQRERERLAKEKLRKERSLEREKLRIHSSDRSRELSHERRRSPSRNRFESSRVSVDRIDNFEYERSESYRGEAHVSRRERDDRIYEKEREREYSRDRDVPRIPSRGSPYVEPPSIRSDHEKYLNRSQESHNFDHHRENRRIERSSYPEQRVVREEWEPPKVERSARIMERPVEIERKEWEPDHPREQTSSSRLYAEPSSSWTDRPSTGQNKWDAGYQNSPTASAPSARNWSSTRTEAKETGNWGTSYTEEVWPERTNVTHQPATSHHHVHQPTQPQHHGYHQASPRHMLGSVGGSNNNNLTPGRRWNEWHGNQPRFGGPKKEMYRKPMGYGQNQAAEGAEEPKFPNHRRSYGDYHGGNFMGPRGPNMGAQQKFGNTGSPQTPVGGFTNKRPAGHLQSPVEVRAAAAPPVVVQTTETVGMQPDLIALKSVKEDLPKIKLIEDVPTTITPVEPVARTDDAEEGDKMIEDNLSEISDDADEILNQEIAIKIASEAEEKAKAEEALAKGVDTAPNSDVPPQQVVPNDPPMETDDIADIKVAQDDLTLDFEEISDGELEEESKIKGLGDALGVDWTSLVAESKMERKPSTAKTSLKEMWDPRKILMDVGISVRMAGKEFVEELVARLNVQSKGIKVEKTDEEGNAEEAGKILEEADAEVFIDPLKYPIACTQVALRRELRARSNLILNRSRPDQMMPALSARRDLQIRRQLCGLPITEINVGAESQPSQELKQMALKLFRKATAMVK